MFDWIRYSFEDLRRWRERLYWRGLLADVELSLLVWPKILPPEARLVLVERAIQLREKLARFDAETMKIKKSRREERR